MKLRATASECFRPPPDLTVSQWADSERKLSAESSAEPGQWRTSRAEYQRGMMDAVNDPKTETVVLMTSAQIGKTELLNNCVGFYMSHDPAPIICLQPTLQMAQAWSKDRLAPMIRDTPILRKKTSDSKRSAGNTILYKSFTGGHITMAGANSPASLASRPIRIVLGDEVDRYPDSAGDEGDPVSLAKKRTTTFWNRKIILTSTPTVKGASRIEYEFELSDKRRFHMPCPHCGEFQHLQWANIVFDKDDLSSVYYACEHNGCAIEHKDKPWMLRRGKWIAEAPFNGRAGFHINELYSPWRKWTEVVESFIEAKGTPETLKTWVNTSLGETWEEKGEGTDFETLLDRREAYDAESLPDDIAVITAAVDVQGDRLEALSQGWGKDRERWNIEHVIFWGDPEKPAVWKELDEWLLKTYSVAGRGLKIACTSVDSGYKTEAVYNYVKPRQARRVFATKGSSVYYGPIASKPSQAGRQRVMLYACGADTAKDSIILSSLKIEEYGPGYIHFPHDVDIEFFKQLVAETRRAKIFKGQRRFEWVTTRDRNEILDLHTGNLCAFSILNPAIDSILSKRKPSQEAPKVKPVKRSTQRPRPIKRRKNWVTDI